MPDYIRKNGKLVKVSSIKSGFWSMEIGGRVYHPPVKKKKGGKK